MNDTVGDGDVSVDNPGTGGSTNDLDDPSLEDLGGNLLHAADSGVDLPADPRRVDGARNSVAGQNLSQVTLTKVLFFVFVYL